MKKITIASAFLLLSINAFSQQNEHGTKPDIVSAKKTNVFVTGEDCAVIRQELKKKIEKIQIVKDIVLIELKECRRNSIPLNDETNPHFVESAELSIRLGEL